ncbi:hypothetical protein SAMN05421803_10920 [Nocardiopsis flavescens]|uniref:Protein N-acetyltransferase, RimJ/RimL family n=1 Tax=Nocardiopsis flavescens TaxID=758803 RepID=A0A1M6LQM8_9ACTN|nr:hypothetical protein SAMN05421803_10920 [Nocardiopsis flavescens]
MLITHLESRNVRLIPVTESNSDQLHGHLLRSGLELVFTVEAQEERISSLLGTNVTAFLVQQKTDGEIVGCCSLRGPEPAGHMNAAIYTERENLAFGVGAESMTLLINFAFARWDAVRKVYFITTDASTDRFDTELVSLPRELTLRDHGFFRGRYWDFYYYSIQREMWETQVAPFVNRLVAAASAGKGTHR